MRKVKRLRIVNKLKPVWSPLIFAPLFAAVGIGLLLTTRAANPVNNAIEAEAGTLSGNVSIGQDSNASDGSYITFNSAPVVTPNSVTGGTDNSCVFQKADKPMHLAFCDNFSIAYNNPASLNRSGDLDNKLWGVSRVNFVNPFQSQTNLWYDSTLKGCGANQTVRPPRDVQICNGVLRESVNDGYGGNGGQTTLAMYPKQPFDFAGRTGTAVFDVSSDSQEPHAAWPEWWLTDQPIPAPVDHRSANFAQPRNGIGIRFVALCQDSNYTGVDTITTFNNYQSSTVSLNPGNQCLLRKSTATDVNLNHIEIRLSQTRVEVWGSDPGSSTLKLLAAGSINLSITKGLTWMVDAHYNACKGGLVQCDHTFAWDNFGFDGPGTYRDLSFDVIDNTTRDGTNASILGYSVPKAGTKSLTVKGVYRLQTPTSALATFNWWPTQTAFVPSFRICGATAGQNCGPWHDTAWPFEDNSTFGWRTIGVSVPVAEIRDGDNTIELRNIQSNDDLTVANINLILVAGSPVPTALQ